MADSPLGKPTEVRPVGRPSKYTKTTAELAYKFCLLGATDEDLARNLEVDVSTISKWKLDFPEFSEAIRAGKEEADAKVAESLFKRATGYEHEAVKIFGDPKTGQSMEIKFTEHYPPDATSMIYWLKNRQRDKWRDRTETDITTKGEAITSDPADKSTVDTLVDLLKAQTATAATDAVD